MAVHDVLSSIGPTTADLVASRVIENARSGSPHFVATANSSHLRFLETDPAFGASYAMADIITADGWPVAALSRLLFGQRSPRVTGAELLSLVVGQLADSSVPVVVFGGSTTATSAFFAQTGLDPSGHVDVRLEDTRTVADCERLVTSLSGSLPPSGLAIVSLSTPRQEYLAATLRRRTDLSILPCGAALDFLTGVKRRAPVWVQRLRAEWLFRMVTEPRRLAPRYYADARILLRLYRRHR